MGVKSMLILFFISSSYVTAFNIPINQLSHHEYTQDNPSMEVVKSQIPHPKCYNYMTNKWTSCPTVHSTNFMNKVKPNEGFVNRKYLGSFPQKYNQFINSDGLNTMITGKPILQNNRRRMFLTPILDHSNVLPWPMNTPLLPQPSKQLINENSINYNSFNVPLSNLIENYNFDPEYTSREPFTAVNNVQKTAEYTTSPSILQETIIRNENMYDNFAYGLDQLERKFYAVTFDKLLGISPVNRKENGISFVQSGLFLLLGLVTLSSEMDLASREEIEKSIKLKLSETDKLSAVTKEILASLPSSHADLKLRWATRLLLWPNHKVTEQFKTGPAAALRMHVNTFNGTETPEEMAAILNNMVEIDSGGSIRNTFEEDDLSDGGQAILLTTLYLRGQWRSAPTLLNGSRIFRDSDDAPTRSVRCIRVNDIMKYADLSEWDAEAIEIFYSTPGLSLLMLVPRGNSLKQLAEHVANTSIHYITQRMHTIRIAVTMPLYTLRMTLLLPNKLQAMGISRLVDTNADRKSLRLSHAVQRLMFWAEAGRNAFKDDGIEWDVSPELEKVVDRPYIFFVRWRNLTLMNGNFVL